MKKISVFVLLVFSSLFLSSCDPGETYYDGDVKNIISIELINYTNDNQDDFLSWVPNHFDDLKNFKLENAEVIQSLDNALIETFINEFKKIQLLSDYYAYDSPKDICIRIVYQDESFYIIYANYQKNSYGGYIGLYDKEGKVTDFTGSFNDVEDYKSLVSKYFSVDLNKA